MLKLIIAIVAGFILLVSFAVHGQEIEDLRTYYAGFKTVKLVDSSRIYKPNTTESDILHYRPVDLDIWYPSKIRTAKRLLFKDLFLLLEQRANQYEGGKKYDGFTDELAQFFAIEFGLGSNDGQKLLQAETNSYANIIPSGEDFPVIIYLAGLNGMGFENFKILEQLTEKGFIVVSVWSVGRYPGNMTNHKLDMMEQVLDAEFALNYLKSQSELTPNLENIGVLGCSWGGMSAAVLIGRNPIFNTFVSLDGTETHYFGNSDEDDSLIEEIHNSKIINCENSRLSYLYLESGNKLDEYTPTREFHFYKRLNSNEKYYLRFFNTRHEDFTSIPSTLQVSKNAIKVNDQITETAVLFFENHLQDKGQFNICYSELLRFGNISAIPFDDDYSKSSGSILQGEIVDAKSGLPLSYVNIGVSNREIGTVSNQNGKYELQIDKRMEKDTLRISTIGYGSKMIALKEMQSKKWNRIEMNEESTQLEEVVVTARGVKKKNLGNETTSKFISTGFRYDQLGAEIGIKINVKKKPAFVDAFNFNISYNRLSARSLFRLNMYSIERGKPFKNIMKENVIIPIDPKQTGLISVDLRKCNILLTEDVIATLEWIKNEGENNKGEAIFFSLGVFNSGTIVKQSSQGKFKKYSNMGVGMNFDVTY